MAELRHVKLAAARRVAETDITYPVTSDVDLPLVGGSVVGRQTAAPNDPDKASLYFACKKGIYSGSAFSAGRNFWWKCPFKMPGVKDRVTRISRSHLGNSKSM